MTIKTCARASTIAKALDTINDGLMDYRAATVLQSLMSHDDLINRARLIDPTGHWRDYKGIVKEAGNRRGKVEASEGTTIHAAVEALVNGRDLSHMPDSVMIPARHVLSEVAALGAEVVATERFTAAINVFPEDIAGTADLVLAHQGRYYIGDIKTVEEVGKNTRLSAMAWAIQTTIYAHGQPYPVGYEPKRDRWGRPQVDTSHAGEWDMPMDRETTIVFEVARDGSGCVSHEIQQDEDAVFLACQARAARKAVRV